MSHDELLRDHERRLFVVETILNGTIKDGKKVDGVMDTLERHSISLFGDSRIPTTGLVQAVERLTNVLKVGIGAAGALQIGWMLFTHFHK